MRHTGIPIIGDVPWGTHFCQFYQDKQDLTDILVPYFKAGLENNEFCMWVTAEPLGAEEAKAALAAEVKDLCEYLRKGQIEILDYSEWYTVGGKFEADRVLQGWVRKLEAATKRGFDGLRLTGNTFWLEKSGWRDFTDYEAAVDSVIGQYQMLAICTYSLLKCGAAEIMDVIANHAFALIKRTGEWTVIESAERKRMEASLRESEIRYQSLFEQMTEGFALHEIICDEQGVPCDYRFLEMNSAFEQLTGLKRADVTGKTVRQILPDDDPKWIRMYGEVALTGKSVHFDNYSPVLGRHFDVFAYRPRPGQFAVLFTDITDHQRAEEALRQEGEKLRHLNRTLKAHSRSDQALFLATDEAAYLQEVCRIIVEDCGHAMVWIGYREEDQAKTVRPVAYSGFETGYLETLGLTWDDTERGRGPTGTAIRTGQVCTCRNMLTDPLFLPWREQAIRRGYASSIVLPLVDGGKTFGALTIYSRDPDPFSDSEVKLLTELAGDLAYGINVLRLRAAHARAEQTLRESEERLRQAADELRRSNQDLEQFAYVSSHDLQEPLRMVTGFMQLLESEYGGKLDATADEYIRYAVDGAHRMRRLIDDLLTYSRVGTKSGASMPEDSARLVNEAIGNLRFAIDESQAEIVRGELPTVWADGRQLVQLFQNLLGNAIKFRGDRPPRIQVSARRDEDTWVFSVKDNGIGIDPQFHQKVFMIFQRLHPKDKYPGTGIGLAVCKKIVDRHGGRIWVESAPGQGSTFCFSLPA